MNEKTLVCEICGKKIVAVPGGLPPDCCGQPMKLKLEICTRPFVAETARTDFVDEPCDDGTDAAGK